MVGAAVTFMTTTKILAGIGAAVAIGGTVALVLQQRTIAQLREADARTQRQVTMLSSESAENMKARGEAEKELMKLQMEIVTLKATGGAGARAAGGSGVRAQSEGGVAAVLPAVNAAVIEKKKASMHRRYDAFFQQRGLTAAQTERMIELWLQQADAREDLQAAVEAIGLSGDTKGIEAMRSKLYEPITKEVREILGKDGYAAYRDYERTSFYRVVFVEPMSDMFSKINAPLSADQTQQLVRSLDTNKQQRKAKPTDIGSTLTMDWDAVINQMSGTLSPVQVNVIRVYGDRQKADKR